MREVIAVPVTDNDLAMMEMMVSDVANDPDHEDDFYMEIEYLNGVWVSVEAVWDDLLGKAYMAVTNQSDRSDSYWFFPSDIKEKRFIDVGGERIVRFCRCI